MTEATSTALADMLVLDLSRRLSGAFCARLLGDLGADVILAEGADGHPLRREAPFLEDVPGPERSLLHAYANFNKRSLDLGPDDDRVRSLLARADVVVVSDADTADTARAHMPRTAVLAAVTPYGLTGPLAQAPGNDLTAYARSGWAAANQQPNRPPLKGSMNQAGYLAGVFAQAGVLASLHERLVSQRGQEVDVSETEALTLVAGPTLLAPSYHGRVTARAAPDVFSGPVPARDGYVSVTFSRAHFWRDAMVALGLDDLAEDPQYLNPLSRREHRAELAPRIEAQIRERERWTLFEQLGLLRCVCGVVQDMADLDANPHLQDRDFFVRSGGGDGAFALPGAPFKLSRTPWSHRRPAPRLGEHAGELLAWVEAGVRA